MAPLIARPDTARTAKQPPARVYRQVVGSPASPGCFSRSSLIRRATAHAGRAGTDRKSGPSLNALPIYEPMLSFAAPHRGSRTVRFGIASTQTPPPCGVARFTAGLAGALGVDGSIVSWVCRRTAAVRRSGRHLGALCHGTQSPAQPCRRRDPAVRSVHHWRFRGRHRRRVTGPVDRGRSHCSESPYLTTAFGARGDCGLGGSCGRVVRGSATTPVSHLRR